MDTTAQAADPQNILTGNAEELAALTPTSTRPPLTPQITFSENSSSLVKCIPNERATFFVKIDCPDDPEILPLKFEWSRGELPIENSDRFRITQTSNAVQLAVEHVQREDAGHYTLYARTKKGSVIRKDVELLVEDRSTGDDPPIFLRRLADLSVKVGTRTRLLVEIRSSTDVKITWYRNDRRICENDRIKQINEGSFYCIEITPVILEDGGQWMIMAENLGGRNSCIAQLNVLVPKAYKSPEFIEELRAILTDQGTVSLECKVVGVPTPVLRWFKDSKEIKAGDVFALTANPDDPTSLGTYTCEAVNCMGKSYSSSKVHVVGRGSREGSLKPADSVHSNAPPPIFTNELRGVSVRIGDPIILGCQVVVPPWPKTVAWYNKEGRIDSNEKYKQIEDGLGLYMIEIKPSESCDEGEWKCVVTSQEGCVGISSCLIDMDIPKNYRKPRFMESLKAVLTDEGLVSFECKVVGFPTPTLKWFKDGQELKPGDVYQLTGTNSLGTYCCVAKNCMGENSSVAVLTIEDIENQLNDEERIMFTQQNQPPKFVTGLKTQDAKINEPFKFTVKVKAIPDPVLSWFRDELPIESNERYNHYAGEEETYHLDVQCVEFVDQAEWKCVAVNDFGTSVTSCFLKLQIPRHYKKPRFLECLRAVLTEEGAVNLECKVIGVPQPVLKWYKDGIELKPGDIHRIISGQDGTCCLGTYTCEARNCMGVVASSASLLGFEDAYKNQKPEPTPNELQRNLSLSTIQEERTSQMYESAVGDITIDEKGDVSFSFDGKEVSVSLYETPDLTEEEALKIVEMYADQISEHVTEQNIVELPPLRFMKETSQSGNLLMEAVVIDIAPDYFVHEEDMRTEAGMDDISICEVTIHGSSGHEEILLDKKTEDFAKQNIEKMEEELAMTAPARKRKKSRGTEVEEYFSLSMSKASESQCDEDTSDLQTFASASNQQTSSKIESLEAEDNILDEVYPPKRRKDKKSPETDSAKTNDAEALLQDVSGAAGDGLQFVKPSKAITDEEEIQSNLRALMPLAKLLKTIETHLVVVENEVTSQSTMMMSPSSADQSIGIIRNVLEPIKQIQGKLKVYSGEIPIEVLFESMEADIRGLHTGLQVIEKCVTMDETGITLIQRTSVCIIDSVGDQFIKTFEEVKNIANTFESEHIKLQAEITADDIQQGIQITQDTIKSQTLLQEAQDIETAQHVSESVAKLQTIPQTLPFEAVTEAKLPSEADSLKLICRPVVKIQQALENLDKELSQEEIEEQLYARVQGTALSNLQGPIDELQLEVDKVEQRVLAAAGSETIEQKINMTILDIVSPPLFELKKGLEIISKQSAGDIHSGMMTVSAIESMIPPLQEIQNGLAQLGQDIEFGQVKEDFAPDSADTQKLLQSIAQGILHFETNIERLSPRLSPNLQSGLVGLKDELSRLIGNILDSSLNKYRLTVLENLKTPIDELNYCLRQTEQKSISGSLSDLIDPIRGLREKAKLGMDILLISDVQKNDLNVQSLKKVKDIIKALEIDIEEHEFKILQKEIELDEKHAIEADQSFVSMREALSLQIEKEEIQRTVQKFEEINLSLANLQSEVMFEDAKTLTSENISALKTMATPIKDILECVAIIRSSAALDSVQEFNADIELKVLREIAEPVSNLAEAIKIVAAPKAIEKLKSISAHENISVLKLLTQPTQELRQCIVQLGDEVPNEEEVKSFNTKQAVLKIARPLVELKNCLDGLLRQTGEETIEDASTMKDMPALKTGAESVSADPQQALVAQEVQVIEEVEELKLDSTKHKNAEVLLSDLKRSLASVLVHCTNYDVSSIKAETLDKLQATVTKLQDFDKYVAEICEPSVREEVASVSEISDDYTLADAVCSLESCVVQVQNILPEEDVMSLSPNKTFESLKLRELSGPLQQLRECLQVFHTQDFEKVETFTAPHVSLASGKLIENLTLLVLAVQENQALESLYSIIEMEHLESFKQILEPIQQLQKAVLEVHDQFHLSQVNNVSSETTIGAFAKPLISLHEAIINIQEQFQYSTFGACPEFKVLQAKSNAIYQLLKYVEQVNFEALENLADMSTQADVSGLETYAASIDVTSEKVQAIQDDHNVVQPADVKACVEDGIKQIDNCLEKPTFKKCKDLKEIEVIMKELKSNLQHMQKELSKDSESESSISAKSNIAKSLFKLKECLVHTYEGGYEESLDDIEKTFEDILQALPDLEVLLADQMSTKVVSKIRETVKISEECAQIHEAHIEFLTRLVVPLSELASDIDELGKSSDTEISKSSARMVGLQSRLMNAFRALNEVSESVPNELLDFVLTGQSVLVSVFDFIEATESLRIIEVIQEIDNLLTPLDGMNEVLREILREAEGEQLYELLKPVKEAQELLKTVQDELAAGSELSNKLIEANESAVKELHEKIEWIENEVLVKEDLSELTLNEVQGIQSISEPLEIIQKSISEILTKENTNVSHKRKAEKDEEKQHKFSRKSEELEAVEEDLQRKPRLSDQIAEDSVAKQILNDVEPKSVDDKIAEETITKKLEEIKANLGEGMFEKYQFLQLLHDRIREVRNRENEKTPIEILSTLEITVNDIEKVLAFSTSANVEDNLFLPLFKMCDLLAFFKDNKEHKEEVKEVLVTANKVFTSILNENSGLRIAFLQDIVQTPKDGLSNLIPLLEEAQGLEICRNLLPIVKAIDETLNNIVSKNHGYLGRSSDVFSVLQHHLNDLQNLTEDVGKRLPVSFNNLCVQPLKMLCITVDDSRTEDVIEVLQEMEALKTPLKILKETMSRNIKSFKNAQELDKSQKLDESKSSKKPNDLETQTEKIKQDEAKENISSIKTEPSYEILDARKSQMESTEEKLKSNLETEAVTETLKSRSETLFSTAETVEADQFETVKESITTVQETKETTKTDSQDQIDFVQPEEIHETKNRAELVKETVTSKEHKQLEETIISETDKSDLITNKDVAMKEEMIEMKANNQETIKAVIEDIQSPKTTETQAIDTHSSQVEEFQVPDSIKEAKMNILNTEIEQEDVEPTEESKAIKTLSKDDIKSAEAQKLDVAEVKGCKSELSIDDIPTLKTFEAEEESRKKSGSVKDVKLEISEDDKQLLEKTANEAVTAEKESNDKTSEETEDDSVVIEKTIEALENLGTDSQTKEVISELNNLKKDLKENADKDFVESVKKAFFKLRDCIVHTYDGSKLADEDEEARLKAVDEAFKNIFETNPVIRNEICIDLMNNTIHSIEELKMVLLNNSDMVLSNNLQTLLKPLCGLKDAIQNLVHLEDESLERSSSKMVLLQSCLMNMYFQCDEISSKQKKEELKTALVEVQKILLNIHDHFEVSSEFIAKIKISEDLSQLSVPVKSILKILTEATHLEKQSIEFKTADVELKETKTSDAAVARSKTAEFSTITCKEQEGVIDSSEAMKKELEENIEQHEHKGENTIDNQKKGENIFDATEVLADVTKDVIPKDPTLGSEIVEKKSLDEFKKVEEKIDDAAKSSGKVSNTEYEETKHIEPQLMKDNLVTEAESAVPKSIVDTNQVETIKDSTVPEVKLESLEYKDFKSKINDVEISDVGAHKLAGEKSVTDPLRVEMTDSKETLLKTEKIELKQAEPQKADISEVTVEKVRETIDDTKTVVVEEIQSKPLNAMHAKEGETNFKESEAKALENELTPTDSQIANTSEVKVEEIKQSFVVDNKKSIEVEEIQPTLLTAQQLTIEKASIKTLAEADESMERVLKSETKEVKLAHPQKADALEVTQDKAKEGLILDNAKNVEIEKIQPEPMAAQQFEVETAKLENVDEIAGIMSKALKLDVRELELDESQKCAISEVKVQEVKEGLLVDNKKTFKIESVRHNTLTAEQFSVETASLETITDSYMKLPELTKANEGAQMIESLDITSETVKDDFAQTSVDSKDSKEQISIELQEAQISSSNEKHKKQNEENKLLVEKQEADFSEVKAEKIERKTLDDSKKQAAEALDSKPDKQTAEIQKLESEEANLEKVVEKPLEFEEIDVNKAATPSKKQNVKADEIEERDNNVPTTKQVKVLDLQSEKQVARLVSVESKIEMPVERSSELKEDKVILEKPQSALTTDVVAEKIEDKIIEVSKSSPVECISVEPKQQMAEIQIKELDNIILKTIDEKVIKVEEKHVEQEAKKANVSEIRIERIEENTLDDSKQILNVTDITSNQQIAESHTKHLEEIKLKSAVDETSKLNKLELADNQNAEVSETQADKIESQQEVAAEASIAEEEGSIEVKESEEIKSHEISSKDAQKAEVHEILFESEAWEDKFKKPNLTDVSLEIQNSHGVVDEKNKKDEETKATKEGRDSKLGTDISVEEQKNSNLLEEEKTKETTKKLEEMKKQEENEHEKIERNEPKDNVEKEVKKSEDEATSKKPEDDKTVKHQKSKEKADKTKTLTRSKSKTSPEKKAEADQIGDEILKKPEEADSEIKKTEEHDTTKLITRRKSKASPEKRNEDEQKCEENTKKEEAEKKTDVIESQKTEEDEKNKTGIISKTTPKNKEESEPRSDERSKKQEVVESQEVEEESKSEKLNASPEKKEEDIQSTDEKVRKPDNDKTTNVSESQSTEEVETKKSQNTEEDETKKLVREKSKASSEKKIEEMQRSDEEGKNPEDDKRKAASESENTEQVETKKIVRRKSKSSPEKKKEDLQSTNEKVRKPDDDKTTNVSESHSTEEVGTKKSQNTEEDETKKSVREKSKDSSEKKIEEMQRSDEEGKKPEDDKRKAASESEKTEQFETKKLVRRKSKSSPEKKKEDLQSTDEKVQKPEDDKKMTVSESQNTEEVETKKLVRRKSKSSPEKKKEDLQSTDEKVQKPEDDKKMTVSESQNTEEVETKKLVRRKSKSSPEKKKEDLQSTDKKVEKPEDDKRTTVSESQNTDEVENKKLVRRKSKTSPEKKKEGLQRSDEEVKKPEPQSTEELETKKIVRRKSKASPEKKTEGEQSCDKTINGVEDDMTVKTAKSEKEVENKNTKTEETKQKKQELEKIVKEKEKPDEISEIDSDYTKKNEKVLSAQSKETHEVLPKPNQDVKTIKEQKTISINTEKLKTITKNVSSDTRVQNSIETSVAELCSLNKKLKAGASDEEILKTISKSYVNLRGKVLHTFEESLLPSIEKDKQLSELQSCLKDILQSSLPFKKFVSNDTMQDSILVMENLKSALIENSSKKTSKNLASIIEPLSNLQTAVESLTKGEEEAFDKSSGRMVNLQSCLMDMYFTCDDMQPHVDKMLLSTVQNVMKAMLKIHDHVENASSSIEKLVMGENISQISAPIKKMYDILKQAQKEDETEVATIETEQTQSEEERSKRQDERTETNETIQLHSEEQMESIKRPAVETSLVEIESSENKTLTQNEMKVNSKASIAPEKSEILEKEHQLLRQADAVKKSSLKKKKSSIDTKEAEGDKSKEKSEALQEQGQEELSKGSVHVESKKEKDTSKIDLKEEHTSAAVVEAEKLQIETESKSLKETEIGKKQSEKQTDAKPEQIDKKGLNEKDEIKTELVHQEEDNKTNDSIKESKEVLLEEKKLKVDATKCDQEKKTESKPVNNVELNKEKLEKGTISDVNPDQKEDLELADPKKNSKTRKLSPKKKLSEKSSIELEVVDSKEIESKNVESQKKSIFDENKIHSSHQIEAPDTDSDETLKKIKLEASEEKTLNLEETFVNSTTHEKIANERAEVATDIGKSESEILMTAKSSPKQRLSKKSKSKVETDVPSEQKVATKDYAEETITSIETEAIKEDVLPKQTDQNDDLVTDETETPRGKMAEILPEKITKRVRPASDSTEKLSKRTESQRVGECFESEEVLVKKHKEEPTTKDRTKESKRAPSFDLKLTNRNSSLGSDIKLTCCVSGSDVSIQWFKDKTPINSGKKYSLSCIDGLSSLEIRTVEKQDSGIYRCIASNRNGDIETSCLVSVYEIPTSQSGTPPIFTRNIRGMYTSSSQPI